MSEPGYSPKVEAYRAALVAWQEAGAAVMDRLADLLLDVQAHDHKNIVTSTSGHAALNLERDQRHAELANAFLSLQRRVAALEAQILPVAQEERDHGHDETGRPPL